jgi:hypothetical protein
LSFKIFVAFAFGKLHSSPSSTRVIFVAKATHVLNDKFCWKKLDHLLYYMYMKKPIGHLFNILLQGNDSADVIILGTICPLIEFTIGKKNRMCRKDAR